VRALILWECDDEPDLGGEITGDRPHECELAGDLTLEFKIVFNLGFGGTGLVDDDKHQPAGISPGVFEALEVVPQGGHVAGDEPGDAVNAWFCSGPESFCIEPRDVGEKLDDVVLECLEMDRERPVDVVRIGSIRVCRRIGRRRLIEVYPRHGTFAGNY
jgi:hypothetical protein